jgi:hypothetical protein
MKSIRHKLEEAARKLGLVPNRDDRDSDLLVFIKRQLSSRRQVATRLKS